MSKDIIHRISHTQKQLYLDSPRAWYFKYKLNLKEEIMGSPLFFGSIVESGVEVLLQGGKLEQAYEVFEKNMKGYHVNGKWENLATSNKVSYSKADWQPHLFTENELKTLDIKTQQFKSHQSLIRSGKMMIKEFNDNIQPKIKKVIETQKYFNIDNGIGDEIMGYADIICEWEDDRLLVPDLKTSGSKYKDDALETEEKGTQTALYYEALKKEYSLDGTGFLVLEKKIRKRDPQTRSQIILGVPSEDIIESTFEQYDQVLSGMKRAIFTCPHDQGEFGTQCTYRKYNKTCAYKNYCESGGTNLTGLKKHSRSKK